MLSRFLARSIRRYSFKAWEVSIETSVSNNSSDEFFHLSPVPSEQAPHLPPGTLAVRPIGRPSAIETLKMEVESKLSLLDNALAAQKIELAAQNLRIKILENQPGILQIFESVKAAETTIIETLLPQETSVLPEHLCNFAYLNSFRLFEEEKMLKSLVDFFENPIVKELSDLMESEEFQIIREYRGDIAHESVDNLSRLRSITKKLVGSISDVPECEASVIKAIQDKLPSIIQIVKDSKKLSETYDF